MNGYSETEIVIWLLGMVIFVVAILFYLNKQPQTVQTRSRATLPSISQQAGNNFDGQDYGTAQGLLAYIRNMTANPQTNEAELVSNVASVLNSTKTQAAQQAVKKAVNSQQIPVNSGQKPSETEVVYVDRPVYIDRQVDRQSINQPRAKRIRRVVNHDPYNDPYYDPNAGGYYYE